MAGLTSAEKSELAVAKRRIAELETELGAARRAMELVREVVPPKRRFEAVTVMAAEHIPVEVSCEVVDVSVSGYYAWRSRPPSARAIRHAWLTDLIVEVHQDSRGTYGARRVHAERRLGREIMVGHGAVELLMRRAGLTRVTGPSKWRHAKPDQIAADLVDRQFSRTSADQLWVTDLERHEAWTNRVEVRDLRRPAVAAVG